MSENERPDSKLDEEKENVIADVGLEKEKDIKDESNGPKIPINIFAASDDAASALSHVAEDDVDADGDSEAETWIQSPEKKRSIADVSTVVHQLKAAGTSDTGSIIIANTSDKENAIRKRKRSTDDSRADSTSSTSSHHSSPLSSPIAHVHSDAESDGRGRAQSMTPPGRNGDQVPTDTVTLPKKRRRRPSELVAPSSHKRSKRSSLDTLERRETRSATYPRPSEDEKSPSPDPPTRREHRRGASTQVISHEFERRKRGRPPTIKTGRNRSADRASDTSENESEPATRARPPLHKLASHDHDTMSPIKTGPRKWKDKNGRTYLARACASEDLELAKDRLVQRPQDLNMEDNAGNTPLQIASLEGFESIVEFLLSKGADVNVRNIDKDTPLIDAIDNGHVEVVKLLLNHGANPRMANAKGEQPLDRVPDDDENAEEIRRLLKDAMKKDPKRTPGLEAFEHHNHERASSRAASAASPRDSPPVGPRSPPISDSRRRTGRSESTRKDLLWTANTQENLVKLAEEGDVQGVASILAVLEKAETESLIAAAKAGHENVLQLLIGLGNPNPDPQPIRGPKIHPGSNTPMLAAIGRGHLDVVKLLASQSGFNPMKKYKDRTYFELAEERQGDRWEDEYETLRQAYDDYAIKNGKKPSSPRKPRDLERSKPGFPRRSSSVKSARRPTSSPTLTHKSLPTKTSDGSTRERRKFSDPSEDKRRLSGHGSIAETSTAVGSDADLTVTNQKKVHRTRRSQSDLPPVPALENESTHKRRRLVTGREHRSRQTISTSDNEDSDMIEVKQEDRLQPALKRSRVSSTPEPTADSRDGRAVSKKRRTVLESSPDEGRTRPNSLPIPVPNGVIINETTNENTNLTDQTHKEDVQVALVQEPQSIERAHVKRESPQPQINSAVDPKTLPDASPPDPPPVLLDANEESDDHYSPPPAEPFIDLAQEEADRKAKEDADRIAAEEKARQERERQEQEAQNEQIAREQAAEENRMRQEAEARKRAEEEAEQSRRQQEEERQEQIKHEIESRRRAEQIEERKRISALPCVLAKTAEMIEEDDPQVRRLPWLNHFLPLYSVRTRQLDPDCPAEAADEEWVPNFQIASLLGTKDLKLLSLMSFNKRSVTDHQRMCLWRVSRTKLSYDLPPNWIPSVDRALEIEGNAEEKFKSMPELFWVKVSCHRHICVALTNSLLAFRLHGSSSTIHTSQRYRTCSTTYFSKIPK